MSAVGAPQDEELVDRARVLHCPMQACWIVLLLAS
jgi:hypothetical protein